MRVSRKREFAVKSELSPRTLGCAESSRDRRRTWRGLPRRIAVFESKTSNVKRVRPLLSLLVPLCLAPLASCANDTYLAQNYSTANPSDGQQGYAVSPPAYGEPNSGQFLAPPQLGEMVSRIALYPDDLIGIILPASTYPLQVVQAARYLEAVRADSTLSPDDSWDNAVVALLNYPDVINMMNQDLTWTERLGQAVILQQSDVIAAIGQFRAQVQAAGNLRSDARQIVESQQGVIRIRPANPQIIYVPQYEPTRVVVYSSEPAYGYYPRPCPVYYYDYSAGVPSGFSNFWGVSTLFTIGWSSSRVHLYDYDYYDDPRFDRPYNGFFYRRSYHHHHDDDDDGPTWGDDDNRGHGRGHGHDDHHSSVDRPRERDWQPQPQVKPRPVTVGGKPGRGNGGVGEELVPRPDAPTRTIREGSERATQLPAGESRVLRGVPSAPSPTSPETQTSERSRSFAPPSGESGLRRGVTVIPTQAPDQAQSVDRARSFSPRPNLASPSASEPMNVRRGGSFQAGPREVIPTPAAPSAGMRMPRYTPSQPAPARSMRNADDGRSSVGIAPSGPEPRMMAPIRPEPRMMAPSGPEPRMMAPSRPEPRMMAPSRPEPRMMAPSRPEPRMMAPSRPEPRAAVPRSADAPAATRRGGDDDRGRGSRER